MSFIACQTTTGYDEREMFRLLTLLFATLPAAAQTAPPAPIDPQRVQDQDTMTWADYRPIPGVHWADPALVPAKKQFRVALIAVDFPDQPFVITLPKHSDLFGNPQIDPVAPISSIRRVRSITARRSTATGWSSRVDRSASARSMSSGRIA
jgi:hypothetical protein